MEKRVTKYQEISLKDVIKFWVDAYEVKIHDYEYFIDIAKGEVILRLTVDKGQLSHPDCNCGRCALCTGDE